MLAGSLSGQKPSASQVEANTQAKLINKAISRMSKLRRLKRLSF
jgi:hypothetical protein